ncbi:MAG TPA: flavodoxin family protein [Acidobacteriota bacterium]|nr:flavodoxin family protein [Acidobacteriota bacterium]
MKILIIYDSMYGNTEKVARAMGEAVTGDVKVIPAGEASSSDVESIDLLIVGSPTQGFRATQAVQTFIEGIPKSFLKGMKVASFDTRMPESDVGRGLRFIMRLGGYAAPRIAKALNKKGAKLVVPPEGFLVKDKEGPLKEGELERAAAWAKGLR